MKKAQIWVSTVIWLLIGTLILALVLSFGLPIFNRTKETVTYQQVVDQFQNLKSTLDSIAKEGVGSQKVVDLSIPKGSVDFSSNGIIWNAVMNYPLFQPQSRMDVNGVIVATDADVSAEEYNNSYILQDSYIKVNITKYPNGTLVNASHLINSITFKMTNQTVHPSYTFYLLNETSTETGIGYTKLLDSGTNLVSATVVAHINSPTVSYDLYLTLYSKGDFIRFKPKNVVLH